MRSGSALINGAGRLLEGESVPLVSLPGSCGEDAGMVIISASSASISLIPISCGETFPCCAISARVLVRSTRVSRPSVLERRRTVMFSTFDFDA